jgi:hypothetical protein
MQQEEDGLTNAEIVKDLVHNWLHQIDHQNPELNPCCFFCMFCVIRPFFEDVKEGRILKKIKQIQILVCLTSLR